MNIPVEKIVIAPEANSLSLSSEREKEV